MLPIGPMIAAVSAAPVHFPRRSETPLFLKTVVCDDPGVTGETRPAITIRLRAPIGRCSPAGGDARLSRSLVRGLALLACFAGDERERGVVELARELGISASSAHRYAATLVALGLLERSPRTRRYRPASP
jgi:hypothetical protein